MIDSLKERVAKAIYESQRPTWAGNIPTPWRCPSRPEKFWESFERDAEAAIQAMIDE